MSIFNVHGTQLQASDMAEVSPAFTTVAQLSAITLPTITRGSEDVFSHDTPVGDVAMKMMDATFSISELSFTVYKDPADPTHDGLTGLESYLNDTEPRDYQIVLTDAAATTIAVTGWIVSKAPQEMPANRGVYQEQWAILPIDKPTVLP